MKRIVCGVLLLVMALSVSSFALEGKVNVQLSEQAQIAGQQLPKGEYKVAYASDGENAQVTLTSADKKLVVKTTAKLVGGPKMSRNAVVTSNGSVIEILLAGKTQFLKF